MKQYICFYSNEVVIKNGQIVDGKGNVSNFPTYQAATVQVNANRTGTSVYS
ncbi:hypothetical protein [Enterococcus faecium]|uniref:hypothetical protein n=1 Tax=Enterococcus faecium TaxID=1352 RepID=UPI002236685F|nr:hypothetical protein [Enterococcus faecium]